MGRREPRETQHPELSTNLFQAVWTEARDKMTDPSPKKLSGHLHLDTRSLPPLDRTGLLLQGWVQASLRLCLLPLSNKASKKPFSIKSLSP